MDGYYDPHPLVTLDRPFAVLAIVTDDARRIGHWLASIEGLPLLDLDRHIEHSTGRSIWELVAHAGEAAYRAHERDYLARALRATPPGVIVAGDGLILDPSARAELNRAARWVALTSSLETAVDRLRQNAHPQTGFWHPTRPEVLLDAAQVDRFWARRMEALTEAPARINLDHLNTRAVQRRVRAELPVAP